MRRLLFLLILACSLGNAFGQAADTAMCRLTPAQFPAVRGLRLGMTPDEVLSVLPTVLNKDELFKQAHSPDHWNVAHSNYAPNQNGDPPQFAGVGAVNMVFYRGKLVEFGINYTEPNYNTGDGVAWQGIADFIARIAEALQVPGFQAWTRGNGGALALKCEGFELQAPNLNFLRVVAAPFWQDDVIARQKTENDEKRRTFRP